MVNTVLGIGKLIIGSFRLFVKDWWHTMRTYAEQ